MLSDRLHRAIVVSVFYRSSKVFCILASVGCRVVVDHKIFYGVMPILGILFDSPPKAPRVQSEHLLGCISFKEVALHGTDATKIIMSSSTVSTNTSGTVN